MRFRVPRLASLGLTGLIAFLLVATSVITGAVARTAEPTNGPFGPAEVASPPVPLDHIVIVMLENHVYDNYFGTYCTTSSAYCTVNGTGLPAGICVPYYPATPAAGCVQPYLNPVANLSMPGLLPHTWGSAHSAYDNGSMDNFYIAEDRVISPFGYYDGTEIPTYWDTAEQYALGDNFFASVQSDSRPNHWFLVASSAPPAGITGGIMGGKNSTQLTPFDEEYLNESNATPTIADELVNSSASWTYYDWNLSKFTYAKTIQSRATIGGPGSAFDYWNPFAAKAVSYTAPMDSHFASNSQFDSDALAGRLPNVSWVIPPGNDTDHPPANITQGQNYVAGLIDSVEASPEWNTTAIFVTWDDYGGFYDHVPPPPLDANGVSMRVPLLVIGPHVRQNYISHHFESFDSLLHLVEWRFHLAPLTARDVQAALPLEYFDFNSTPRAPLRISPYASAHYPLPFQGLGAPRSPISLTGTPGPGSVTLNWSLSVAGAAIGTYVLTYGPASHPTQSVTRIDASLTSTTVSNLAPGVTYQFSLVSVGGQNSSGAARATAVAGSGGSNVPPAVAASWESLAPPGADPSARRGASFVYDAADQADLLFGGVNATGSDLGDTWEYIGGTWVPLVVATAPSPRAFAAITYDSTDGTVLLFGGQTAHGYAGDTWAFHAGVWTNLTTSLFKTGATPTARSASALADDPSLGAVVLFGGSGKSGPLGDTWQFAKVKWTQVRGLTTTPSARYLAAATFDGLDDYLVLYGGNSSTGSPMNDTWTYTSSGWTHLTTPASPGARGGASMVYDARDMYVVLFGGTGSFGFQAKTWRYAGGGWTALTPTVSPPVRTQASIAYDPLHQGVLLLAGREAHSVGSDLWAYVPPVRIGVSASPTAGSSPLLVSFDPTVSGGMLPYKYSWTFGDGGTGAILYPSHYYAVAGVYTANLTVVDAGGARTTVGVPITATGTFSVLVGATAPTSNGTVDFAATVGGGLPPYQFSWDFGNGLGTSTLSGPVYRYSGAGAYVARVAVTDYVGTVAHGLASVNITSGVHVTMASNVSAGGAPLAVAFSANASNGSAPYSYSWAFGDGSATGYGTSLNHTFQTAGNYTVEVFAADANGSRSVASTVIDADGPIRVHAVARPIYSNASGSSTSAVQFGADVVGGSGRYFLDWVFGDGADSMAIAPVHAFASGGSYTISLTVVDTEGQRVAHTFVMNISAARPAATGPLVPSGPLLALTGGPGGGSDSLALSAPNLATPPAPVIATALARSERWEPSPRRAVLPRSTAA